MIGFKRLAGLINKIQQINMLEAKWVTVKMEKLYIFNYLFWLKGVTGYSFGSFCLVIVALCNAYVFYGILLLELLLTCARVKGLFM